MADGKLLGSSEASQSLAHPFISWPDSELPEQPSLTLLHLQGQARNYPVRLLVRVESHYRLSLEI